MNKPVPKIVLKGLKKRFGPKVVLDGIDLELATGESLVVIGGSGSGKSVLLKCVIGIMEPDAGTVLIDGEETTHLSPGERTRVMHKFGMSARPRMAAASSSATDATVFVLRIPP